MYLYTKLYNTGKLLNYNIKHDIIDIIIYSMYILFWGEHYDTTPYIHESIIKVQR